jgi:hypothetical protein
MTEEELEQALDADDEYPLTTAVCECEVGQAKRQAFRDKWWPILEAEVERINRKYAKEG